MGISPSRLVWAALVIAGATPIGVTVSTVNDVTTVTGTGGDDTIDLSQITSHTVLVDGRGGADTVILPASAGWYKFSTDGRGRAVAREVHASGRATTMTGIQRLRFADESGRSYDLSGHALGMAADASAPAPVAAPGHAGPPLRERIPVRIRAGIVTAPPVPHAAAKGDIVGFRLENPTASVAKAGVISFGQMFTHGSVKPGEALHARLNGVDHPVQMDVKTTHTDGSVAHALLSLAAPEIAANGSVEGVLARGAATGAPAAVITADTLPSRGYDLKLAITIHNADGSKSDHTVDGAATLRAALANHTVQTWMSGPLAGEFRVDAPVDANLHTLLDIRLGADGRIRTGVIFANDHSFTSSATVTYDAAISQGGHALYRDAGIAQYRNSSWRKVVWTGGADRVDVIFDMTYLEKTGALPAYDTSIGVSAATLATNDAALAAANTGPMGNALVTMGMRTTGGRPDIGPTTAWSAAYLVSQDPGARQVMLANADAAGSAPWRFIDEATGTFVRVDQHPEMWIDDRGPASGPDALGTPYANVDTTTGWDLDQAHTPDLDYIPYLVTGDHYCLDQVLALASWRLAAENYRNTVGIQQVRQVAWTLRDIGHAAFITPDGDPLKGYFTAQLNHKLRMMTDAWVGKTGPVAGWIPDGDKTITDPWMQDFLAIVLNDLIQQGFPAAALARWMTNFVAGRFTSGAEGFDPVGGAAYNLTVMRNGKPLATWAEVWAASFGDKAPTPDAIGAYPALPSGYAAVARAALASLITATGSPRALQAYDVVTAQMAARGGLSTYVNDPTWAIKPIRAPH